jgi:hypothetical protein
MPGCYLEAPYLDSCIRSLFLRKDNLMFASRKFFEVGE